MMMLKLISNRFFRSDICRLFFRLGLLIMVACSCSNSDVYIISEQDSLRKKKLTDSAGVLIMPPEVKYSRYTFILDSSSKVFFYALEDKRQNEGGVYDELEPDSLGLTTNQLVPVPKGTEDLFIKENILKYNKHRKIKTITVASFKDTVDGDFLKSLNSIVDGKISLRVRLVLPEEKSVVLRKIQD